MIIPLPENLRESALKVKAENQKFFTYLKKRKINVDDLVHGIHDEIFDEIDCLQCAACCKTLGPRISNHDIQKMAKFLKMKPSDFVLQYIKTDEDGDDVFVNMPCPFLMPDNYCSVYEARPKACKEYPHTNQKRFLTIAKLTIANTETCPAVFEIVERLKKAVKS